MATHTMQELMEEVQDMFTTLKPKLAEECRRQFILGRQEQLDRMSGRGRIPKSNGSERQGTPTKKSSEIQRLQILNPSSPLIQPATRSMAQKAVAEVAFVFGHQLDKDQVEAMAGVIIAGGWTVAELEYAAAFIPADEELCQTITYNRTINPTVFAKAKKRKEVMRGRTFTRSEAMQLCEYKDFYFTFEQFRFNESTVYVMR